MTPKFIKKLDDWSIQFKQKLWTQSDDTLSKVQNSRLNYFIRTALVIAVLMTLLFTVLLTVEFVRGDHPIFGSERNGAICNDGWRSYSTGRGTCSHHGGVDHWTYPQIGFHYYNPQPYWIIIACSFSLMILFSVVSVAFRHRLLAFIGEGLYWSGYVVYISIATVTLIVIIPFYILYSLFKVIFGRKM